MPAKYTNVIFFKSGNGKKSVASEPHRRKNEGGDNYDKILIFRIGGEDFKGVAQTRALFKRARAVGKENVNAFAL